MIHEENLDDLIKEVINEEIESSPAPLLSSEVVWERIQHQLNQHLRSQE